MGGSGGGYFHISNPTELTKKLREAEEKTTSDHFETEVSGLINELLARYNNRDIELISKHIERIKLALEKDIEGSLDLLYGGSVSKHTYVDGLSDIDALVILNKSELKEMSPEEVKSYFYSRLKESLPNTDIHRGKLAVTIKFSDAEIQILPAVKIESGIKIADSTGREWAKINPEKFTSHLTDVNKNVQNKLIPTIKMVKSIISTLPENRQLTGYHVEALAVEIFKNYDGRNTTKSMLKHFFTEATEKVMSPIKDKTGQSIHVDDYLGSDGSLERKIVSDTLNRISRKLKNADGSQSLDKWKDILGEGN